MKIKQHKESGLWIREDGAVLMPAHRNHINPKLRKFRWTYGCKNSDGYMVVGFRGKMYRVHKLVIEAFIENKLGLPTCDHKNRVRDDNRLENLRYCSYKTQADNKQKVDDSVARYGVRCCDNPTAYAQARYAKDPKVAEGQRAYKRALYANNPEYAERQLARGREWRKKQKALGKRKRKCPDGKQRLLTDEEFDKRYKDGLK